MTKQQENKAFAKMIKEFPKAFGRVSFRERLMLRTAFTYVVEEVAGDIKANCDLAIEGRDIKIMELEDHLAEEVELHLHAEEYTKSIEQENNKLLDVINNQDIKIADLEKENAELPSIAFQQGAEWYKKKADVKLTKAKKLLNEFMRIGKASDEDFEHDYSELIMETEQFLNSEVVK